MRFSVISLFPEIIAAYTASSIIGRALKKQAFELANINLRDFAVNAYGKVDDALYGGGLGMLLQAEPLYKAWQAAQSYYKDQHCCSPRCERSIYLSPRGKVFTQQMAGELSACEHVILICGHYEGVDQRFLDESKVDEISLGDFVLTGGELPALALLDATCRLLPGVLPAAEVWQAESHSNARLEESHYTRPAQWHGRAVPSVLLSGHQAHINEWKAAMALYETVLRRPELLSEQKITSAEWLSLLKLIDKS